MSRRENLIAAAIAALTLLLGAAAAWWLLDDEATPTAGSEVRLTAPAATEAPAATSGGERDGSRIALEIPKQASAVVWVKRGRTAVLRSRPGGEVVQRADRQTEFGSLSVFGVVRQRGEWAGVTTPALPNNQLAWLRLDPDQLAAGWTKLSLVVDLSARRAELRAADRVRDSFAVTVGAPGSETPTGRFAVTDTFRGGLNSAYGCCAVALSATQPNLPSGWLGGNRIAIHGNPGMLGAAVSSGCIRAADEKVSELVNRLPLGTPVIIRS